MNNKEKARQWYQDNKERAKEAARNYYQANKEKKIASAKEYAKTHREQRRASGKRYYQKYKMEQKPHRGLKRKSTVLAHYGLEGNLACVNCGFSDIRALTIDHKGGGGNKHRKAVGNIYLYLLRNNFPSGYQTLCMNCQFIKREENHENRWHQSINTKTQFPSEPGLL